MWKKSFELFFFFEILRTHGNNMKYIYPLLNLLSCWELSSPWPGLAPRLDM